MKPNQNYCVILAGGIGSRLWPLSTEDKPKQFLDLFGTGRTLLQQTYERFRRFIQPDHIYISTNLRYLPLIEEQLPEVARAQIIAEPVRRGTLASVALSSLIIAAKRDAQANVICSPADQLIADEETFREDVLGGLEFVANNDRLLTMGLTPTRPETEYGYIQMGDDVQDEFFRVKSFSEKPAREYVDMFLQTGEFLWNSGLFVYNVQTMLRQLRKQVPAYQVELPRMMEELAKSEERKVPEFFSVLPNLNIDYGVLEGNDNVYVQRVRFGWVDLGTWGTLHKDLHGKSVENLMLNTDSLLYNCEGNVVSLPDGHMAVISGLKDFVVAEENGVLMICPKNDTSLIRKLRAEALLKMGITKV